MSLSPTLIIAIDTCRVKYNASHSSLDAAIIGDLILLIQGCDSPFATESRNCYRSTSSDKARKPSERIKH
jgi:hypothetical protein